MKLPWGVLELLDAETGTVIWQRKLATMDQQVDHLIVGPDINHDGHREVFTATLVGVDFDLYIDALSGKNGLSLWTTRERLLPRQTDAYITEHQSAPQFFLGPLMWWKHTADGWPQLVVAVRETTPDRRRGFFFSAADGSLTRSTGGLQRMQPADVDGDGADELVTCRSVSEERTSLVVFRGLGMDRWRWLDAPGQPIEDLDGDDVRDVLFVGRGEVHARSGRTGSLLWRSNFRRVAEPSASIVVPTAARGVRDLDPALTARCSGRRTFRPVPCQLTHSARFHHRRSPT